jgi:hypothetical protein
MKSLNWKVVLRTVTALAIIDCVLLTLTFLASPHGTSLLGVATWILNAPGMLLLLPTGLLESIVHSDSSLVASMIFGGILSISVWSVIFGYVFRNKVVA